MRAGEHVRRLQIHRARGRLAVALEIHHSGHRGDDVRERRPCRERAVLTEARDRAVDEARLDGAQVGGTDAELGGDARDEVLDRDVRHPREVERHRASLGIREVDPDAQLARVDANEVRRLIAPALFELDVAAPRVVAFTGSLDLDHARAEIGEEPRAVRAGEDTGEVEHRDAVEQGRGH